MNFARRYPASLWVASLMIFGVGLAIALDALEWLPPPTSHFGYAGTTKILFFTLLCLAAGIGIVAMRQSRQLRDERIQTGRREEAIHARTRVLERIASGETLSEVLSSLVLTVEKENPGMRCSVLLLDQEHLRHGAAPSLPDEYNRALDGIKIGPEVGSCGPPTCVGV